LGLSTETKGVIVENFPATSYDRWKIGDAQRESMYDWEDDEPMDTFDKELEEALDEYEIDSIDQDAFTWGFEAGYMAGIDRGMEIEHEVHRDERLINDSL